jgi:hypothetical protein
MPFDPALPAPNSPLQSQVLRDQLQALFVLINNVASVSAAQVDGVNTVPPGTPAAAAATVMGNTLRLTFDLPQGEPGSSGNEGPPGPPFAQAQVSSVNTLPPGNPATVGVSFDGTNVLFSFDIPQGIDGATGAPGEVSQAQLDAGLLTTLDQCSNNSNSVDLMGQTAAATYDASQMQALLSKMDELISALRR